jgi:hypothetical protein
MIFLNPGPSRITTGKEARRMGLSRYNTGQPCIHGHMSDRRARDGKCIACRNAKARRNTQRAQEYAACAGIRSVRVVRIARGKCHERPRFWAF